MRIWDFLKRDKTPIDIENHKEYKRITIKLYHWWVFLRDIEKWNNIWTKKQFVVKEWQFIVSKIDARNWAFGIINKELDNAIITGNFWAFDVDHNKVNIERFNSFVSSKSFALICEKSSSWATNRKYLDENKFLNYEINLPSLETQTKDVTVYHKLSKINQDLWNKLNIYVLKQLRQSILQDAIRGKLVPQDPNDEPASELLKKIKAEKEQLIKEKKIKKGKELASISESEIPFDLPKWWEWVRLWEISYLITDWTHQTPNYVDEWVPFLSVKNIAHWTIDFSNTKFISQEEHEELTKRCKPEFWDMLLTKVWTTGIAKIIDTEKEFSIFVSVALIKFFKNEIHWKYLEYLINSPYVRDLSEKWTEGIWNKNLVLRKIVDFILPLPPLAEQERIVAKVDELMRLCNQLEAQVNEAKVNWEKLMESVLGEVFR